MTLHEVGLLVFSQGFALSRDEYIIRELAFCDWTGHHHGLFKYLLPPGVSYNQLFMSINVLELIILANPSSQCNRPYLYLPIRKYRFMLQIKNTTLEFLLLAGDFNAHF